MEFIVQTGKHDTRRTVTWKEVAAVDNATLPRYAPLFSLVCASIQLVGVAGGATVTLMGSNDGVTYHTLKDLMGNNISLTSAGIIEFSSGVAFVKPNIVGGAGDFDLVLTHWQG